MPMPFHCIECDKPINEGTLCDKCREEENETICTTKSIRNRNYVCYPT